MANSEADKQGMLKSNSKFADQDNFNPSEYSILLIDDDRDQLMHFQELLCNRGFRAIARNSPLEGMSLLGRIYFDLLICDLNMPGLDGYALIEKVRKVKNIPAGNTVPIIALSATNPTSTHYAKDIGADIFCEKRLADYTLLPRIRELLENS